MGELRDRMEAGLALKGYAEVTRSECLRCARQLAARYRRPPAELGAEDVRHYLLHLAHDIGYGPANLKMHIAALKFLYNVTLLLPGVVERLPGFPGRSYGVYLEASCWADRAAGQSTYAVVTVVV